MLCNRSLSLKKSARYLCALGAACFLGNSARAQSRPNIVWIFSDDHSYQTIGAYGGQLQQLNPTPNIDKLAEQGMRFNRCYVANSICAPSRATLLTGLHSHLNGKLANDSTLFDHNQQQFQKILQGNGYQTAMIGKIHLDGKMQGFDYWEVLPGQGRYENPEFVTEQGKTSYKGYVTDIITDKALDWMDNKRDKEKPFMLMIHQKAPHRSWHPAMRHMNLYEDIDIPEPDTLFDDYATRCSAAYGQKMTIANDMFMLDDLKVGPKYSKQGNQYYRRNQWYQKNKPQGQDLTRWKYQLYMKDYLRCIKAVDENIGRVMEYLEESGLDDNTIVMYSSDQGFYMGEHGWFDKRFMYEESFRTPLIVRWPGTVKPGTVNNDLVQNIDFAETFLDIAGTDIPGNMQGKSILPILKGESTPNWRKSLYYHYYEYPGWHSVLRHEGVFDGRYKLIRFYGKDAVNGEEWELYDLASDPAELNNIYDKPENKATIERMVQELKTLKIQYKVPKDETDLSCTI